MGCRCATCADRRHAPQRSSRRRWPRQSAGCLQGCARYTEPQARRSSGNERPDSPAAAWRPADRPVAPAPVVRVSTNSRMQPAIRNTRAAQWKSSMARASSWPSVPQDCRLVPTTGPSACTRPRISISARRVSLQREREGHLRNRHGVGGKCSRIDSTAAPSSRVCADV